MAKIEKNKPLPDHTKLDYDECYAKILLEKVFAERYCDLQLTDKPDLRDKSNTIGIEVTSAVPTSKREAERLWYMMPYIDAQSAERKKERMAQLGITYTGGIQVWQSTTYSLQDFDTSPFVKVIDVFKTKIEKLNTGQYAQLTQYDLYIKTELFMVECFLPEILERAAELNSKQNKFHFLYLEFLDEMCSFDLMAKSYEIREYQAEQYNIAIAARELVERAENDD